MSRTLTEDLAALRAGTAWADGAKPHQAKGPTGVAIRSLLRLVERSQ